MHVQRSTEQDLDEAAPPPQEVPPAIDDDAVKALLVRLARPHRSGGVVVERAALLAAGLDLDTVVAFIEREGGAPEAPEASGARRGLHSSRASAPVDAPAPRRYVLPAAALR